MRKGRRVVLVAEEEGVVTDINMDDLFGGEFHGRNVYF